MLEESRSSIIQALLEILYYGGKSYSPKPSEDEFKKNIAIYHAGVRELMERIEHYPQMYVREKGALQFIEEFIKNMPEEYSLINCLHYLFDLLVFSNADDFTMKIGDKLMRQFLIVVKAAQDEYNAR